MHLSSISPRVSPERTPTTHRRVHMLWTTGMSKRAIARQEGIPEATVRRYICEFQERGRSYTLDRPGRHRKLDARDERLLIRQITQHHRNPWTYHAQNWGISDATPNPGWFDAAHA